MRKNIIGMVLSFRRWTKQHWPEWPELARKFGWHKTSKGLGNVSVEFACLFCAVSRIPVAYAFAKANTSEIKLFKKLFKHLGSKTVLLIDNGYYSFVLFKELLREKTRHFIIPLAITTKPKLIKKLGPHEYLAEIKNSRNKEEVMTARVIYVYRKGFRRKRLLTSLLNAKVYPAGEIAELYHVRWSIETFYGEFKDEMDAAKWHCQKIESFKRELICKIIVFCIIRKAMSEAALKRRLTPGCMSFRRAFTEMGVFFKKILLHIGIQRRKWEKDWRDFVDACGRHIIKKKPGRSFSRNKQEYRKKGRGLDRGKVGRPPKPIKYKNVEKSEYLCRPNGLMYLTN